MNDGTRATCGRHVHALMNVAGSGTQSITLESATFIMLRSCQPDATR